MRKVLIFILLTGCSAASSQGIVAFNFPKTEQIESDLYNDYTKIIKECKSHHLSYSKEEGLKCKTP